MTNPLLAPWDAPFGLPPFERIGEAHFGPAFATVAGCFRHTNPHIEALEDQCPDWGEVNRGRLDARLGEIDRRLEGRDWIAADRLTIADITALVAVEFLRVIKHPIPEGYTNLLAWLERMRARPSTAS